MYVFFPERKIKDGFLIGGDELKHLRVRRIRRGEEIGVIHEGQIFRCVLEDLSGNRALCRITGRVEVWEPPVEVILLQGVTSDLKTMDLIVQKATEVGASRLVLLLTERGFRNREAIEKRKERWKRIVRETMKQCNRPTPLHIEGPLELESAELYGDRRILLHRDAGSVPLSEVKVVPGSSFAVAVGPEGGFSEREISLLVSKGFQPVRLDTYILRSETAATVAVGFIVTLAGS
jgi:16S rRNA (uracil1498-N3)-methyltransferase